ncbi:MFS transporter, partial [Pseudomonas syringae pv. tagetis]
ARFLCTSAVQVFAYVAICLSDIGFTPASAQFCPIPHGYLYPPIAPAVNALINTNGNLGGFLAPTTNAFLDQTTGSIHAGL